MSLTKHSTMLDLIYADDTVQYSGKVMPAGSVACMALNISKEDLAAAKPLCQQIAPAEVTLLFPFVDEKDMESARIAAHSIVRIISRYELFSFFDVPNIDQWLDQVFSMKTASRIPEFSKILSSGQMDDQTAEKYGPEITLQILAPFLVHFYDAVTQLQEHLAPFAETLDAPNKQRTKDAYLFQFSKSFPEEIHLGDGSNSWMSLMNVSIQYTAGNDVQDQRWQMQKHMHFTSLASMLRTDFFEGLSVGHAPKRCGICGRWFLTTNARKTKYCTDICPDDPAGRKCKAIASRLGRVARERAEDHQLNEPFKRCMNWIYQAIRRNKLDPELADVMKKLARDKKQRAIADLKYAKGSYMKEMDQKALKAEAERFLQHT